MSGRLCLCVIVARCPVFVEGLGHLELLEHPVVHSIASLAGLGLVRYAHLR